MKARRSHDESPRPAAFVIDRPLRYGAKQGAQSCCNAGLQTWKQGDMR